MSQTPTGAVSFTGGSDLFEVKGLTDADLAQINERYGDLSDLKVSQLFEIARRRMLEASKKGAFDPESWSVSLSIGDHPT
jgi:hypothetical protein